MAHGAIRPRATADAVAAVVDEYLPKGGFYFAVSTFGADMKLHTPPDTPFSNDRAVLDAALEALPDPPEIPTTMPH